MPSFTLAIDQRFRVGDTINCYPASTSPLIPLSLTPVDSAVVAADSTTTFADLEYATRYLAGKTAAGPFVTFATDTAPVSGGQTGGGDAPIITFTIDSEPDPGDYTDGTLWIERAP